MEEKEEFNGFDDTGWDNIGEYLGNLIKGAKNEGRYKEILSTPDIPNYLKEYREKNK
ncbi:MAG: hypothetical protein ACI4ON_00390 [Clostridia bacterium]